MYLSYSGDNHSHHQTKAGHAQCVHGCSVFPSVKAAGLSRSFTRGTAVSAHSETPTGLVSLKDKSKAKGDF